MGEGREGEGCEESVGSRQVEWRLMHPVLSVGSQDNWWFLHLHSSMGGMGLGTPGWLLRKARREGGGLLPCLFQGSRGFVFFPWDEASNASRLSKLQVREVRRCKRYGVERPAPFREDLSPPVEGPRHWG